MKVSPKGPVTAHTTHEPVGYVAVRKVIETGVEFKLGGDVDSVGAIVDRQIAEALATRQKLLDITVEFTDEMWQALVQHDEFAR